MSNNQSGGFGGCPCWLGGLSGIWGVLGLLNEKNAGCHRFPHPESNFGLLGVVSPAQKRDRVRDPQAEQLSVSIRRRAIRYIEITHTNYSLVNIGRVMLKRVCVIVLYQPTKAFLVISW